MDKTRTASSMTSSSNVPLSKVRRDPGHWITETTASRSRATTSTTTLLRLSEHSPNLSHSSSTRRKHTVLHAIQVAAVDGRDEAASSEAEDDAWC
jgi:hypothetical protein